MTAAASGLADHVIFEAEGARHTLRLTPGAWIEIEDAGLGNINSVAANIKENPSFKTFLIVFAAALRGGQAAGAEAFTDAAALDLANVVGSEAIIDLVTKSIEASFPKAMASAKATEGNGAKKPLPKPAK